MFESMCAGKCMGWTLSEQGKPFQLLPNRACTGGGQGLFLPRACWRQRQSRLVPAGAHIKMSRWPSFLAGGGDNMTSSCGGRFMARMADMASNKAAAPGNLTGDTTVAAAAAGSGGRHLEPCAWDDFFASYIPPPSQKSEDWMGERADKLKAQVRGMFVTGEAMSVADMLCLVDTLERLGIDNHFTKEIDMTLSRIYGEELDSESSNDLPVVALRFCLLRQHGFWVSADVFNKFRDGSGNFKLDLTTDVRGLLSLYNAAHMAVPGETALDDIIAFARCHLELLKGNLRSPIAEQVSRALEIPRPRFMRPLEAMHYISEYEQEEAHNAFMLELAKLDFSITRSLRLKELMSLSLWWKDLYNNVKLPYARDRVVEAYFCANGLCPDEENPHARIILAKVFAIFNLIDDTYDTHATLEEGRMLNDAIQRHDSFTSVWLEYTPSI